MFAERLFDRWGARAVFFGRFIALLRIFAGPLAGALKMRYSRFLLANVSGALCWAGGTTALVYYAGMAAERWLTRGFSWIALVVAVVGGVCRWPSCCVHLARSPTSRPSSLLRNPGTPPCRHEPAGGVTLGYFFACHRLRRRRCHSASSAPHFSISDKKSGQNSRRRFKVCQKARFASEISTTSAQLRPVTICLLPVSRNILSIAHFGDAVSAGRLGSCLPFATTRIPSVVITL